MLKVVPLRYGTAFKKAFSDPLVFSALVKAAVGIDFFTDHVEQEYSWLKDEAGWEAAKREARLAGVDEGKKVGIEKGKKVGIEKGKKVGIDEGKRLGQQAGEVKRLREAIADLCEAYGIALNKAHRSHLAALDLAGLEALRSHLKARRAWPD